MLTSSITLTTLLTCKGPVYMKGDNGIQTSLHISTTQMQKDNLFFNKTLQCNLIRVCCIQTVTKTIYIPTKIHK